MLGAPADSDDHDRTGVLADLCALTSAEARGVSQLISGGGLAKAATRRGQSLADA